jgi:hypothetical protein|tara:strand:+ start:641 stop:1120 length:480 start_codon:yes stop_codon:yes gene_type:complete
MRIIISLLFLVFVGCKSTTTKTSKVNEVAFQTVSKGALFGNGMEGISESNFTINTAKEWETFLEKIGLKDKVSTNFSKEPIDFSKHILVCVFDTIRNTGGFEIEIENILIVKNGINTLYSSKKPGPKDLVTMVVTQPYHLVKTEKREGTITFINKDNIQ